MSSLEKIEACDLCGSSRQVYFEDYEVHGEQFPLVEYGDCGLAYLSRRPSEQDMPAWYDKAYNVRHSVYREPALRQPLYAGLRWLLKAASGLAPVFMPDGAGSAAIAVSGGGEE